MSSRKIASAETPVVIQFEHVTKTYRLYKNDRTRFLSAFLPGDRGTVGIVHANNDLSFEIYKGEAVALIGSNGAGKSTALKIITGVCHPTSGIVNINGRVSALLELRAGFDSKLTGRENLELRSQILGIDKYEFKKRILPEVIDFADLGIYIDQPIKTYSSGMRARLGFALAAHIDPDILVVDEALAVGDSLFKKKCIKRMKEIMFKEDVTVLFVAHGSRAARKFCTRGIVIDKGHNVFDGTVDEAGLFYKQLCQKRTRKR